MLLSTDEKNKLDLLFRQYERKLYFLALKIMRDPSAADDVVQNAFYNIIRNVDNIKDVESVKTKAYLCTIVHNAAIDYHRKIKRQNFVTEPLDENVYTIPGEFPELSEYGQEPFGETLDKAIRKLSFHEQEVLLLKYREDLSNDEIAARLGTSNAVVRQRLSRAKRKLAAILNP